jgi:NAD(P)-dependent dehydrogenase (short-subunit alcohol dehydrogenase family)
MPTALILGASRGIGREFVRQLVADRWKVYATARDAAVLAALQAEGATALPLDVTQPEQLASLGRELNGIKLDLAVYVAGVFVSRQGAETAPTQTDFDATMHANVLGAMQAIPLVAPMVEAANGKFAFITSGMGSIADASYSMGWIYRVSKAGLNMAVRAAAFDYPKATFAALSPGWVLTDMGGPDASITVEQSVQGMRKVIAALALKDSGSYRNYDGKRLAW